MPKGVTEQKEALYKVVKTVDDISGESVVMYGIEGELNGEIVSITSLSPDFERIQRLVKTMNSCRLELCQLKDVVDDFIYEYNNRKQIK